jgi:hypothetical protein
MPVTLALPVEVAVVLNSVLPPNNVIGQGEFDVNLLGRCVASGSIDNSLVTSRVIDSTSYFSPGNGSFGTYVTHIS